MPYSRTIIVHKKPSSLPHSGFENSSRVGSAIPPIKWQNMEGIRQVYAGYFFASILMLLLSYMLQINYRDKLLLTVTRTLITVYDAYARAAR